MIDLATLLAYLQSLGSPLKLEADDAHLPAELQAFLQNLPGAGATLVPGAGGLVLANDVLTIEGSSADTWPVAGMGTLVLTLTGLTLTVRNAAGAAAFTGVATGTLPFSPTLPAPVTATYQPEQASATGPTPASWLVQLAGATTGVTPTELLLLGATGGTLPFDVPPQLDVLSQALTTNPAAFQLTFRPNGTDPALLAFGLSAPAATWQPLPQLDFAGLDISAFVQPGALSVTLIGHIVVGTAPGVGVDVGVAMNTGPDWTAFVQPPTGQRWPSLLDFANWLGGGALAQDTQQGFSSTNLSTSAFDLELTRVTLGFNWQKPAVNSLQVQSILTVAALPLDVVLTLPDLSIVGTLHDGQAVLVTDMLAACGLPTTGVPTAMKITAAGFSAQLPQGQYAANVTVADVWQAGPVSLEEVSANINYASGDGFTGEFACQLAIGSMALYLSAGYEGPAQGWLFAGGTVAGTSLAIGELLASLATDFGINADAVPAPIASLSLTNLSLSYDTGTGTFAFSCEGDFDVAGEPVKMVVFITVTTTTATDAADAQTVVGSKGYSATFGGKLTVADLQFDLVFNVQSAGTMMFVADYLNLTATSRPLRELVAGISTSVAEVIPASLNIDVREVKFLFLKQTAGSQWAFGLGLGVSISLADIPVIGSKLPAGLDLALKDFQITYASLAFSAAQDALLNPLLPEGIRPLPAAGLGAGISFAGLIQLGSYQKMLGVDVPPDPPKPPTDGAGSHAVAAATPTPDPVHWVNINKQVGIFQFDRIGASYQDNVFSIVLDAGITLGPVAFAVLGLAVGSPLTHFEPVFDLSGLALSLNVPPIALSGAFLKVQEESGGRSITSFYGEVMAQVGSFGFKVLGGWAPEADPASFFLYANISAPLGGPPYFFLTGLAGGFGLNRTLRLPTLEELPNYILLPGKAPAAEGSALATIKKVLPQLEHVFQNQPGEYWMAAGVQFSSFKMINAFALVTVAFGVDLQVAVLGTCSMEFPPLTKSPVAYLEVDLMASFSTASGLLAVGGCLSPASYVFADVIKLSGGFAFYVWVMGEHTGDFVVSLGGYAPGYVRPPHYPTVPRLALGMNLGPLQVLGQSYFALTPAMFMAGMRMQATFALGPIKAWFDAGVDCLIAWAPFHYEAAAHVLVGVSVDLGLFTLTVQVGADLEVWGPDFGGQMHIDLDVVAFTIAFGAPATPTVPLGWQEFSAQFLPSANATPPPPVLAARGTVLLATNPAPVNTNIINATAAAGLQQQNVGGYDWVLDANAFQIETNSTIPANAANWNSADAQALAISNNPADYTGQPAADGLLLKAAANPFDATNVWNPALSIGPMNQAGVKSAHNIALYQRTDADPQGHYSKPWYEVQVQPLLLNSTSALWAENTPNADKTANDPAHVPSTLVGFRITPLPRHPTEVSNVPLFMLLFQSGFRTGFAYQKAVVNPDFTLSITQDTPDELLIAVAGQHTANLPNTDYLLQSLVDPWVSSQRNVLLTDLINNNFTTFAPAQVNPQILATQQALTDWPMVEMIGALI